MLTKVCTSSIDFEKVSKEDVDESNDTLTPISFEELGENPF